MTFIQQGTSAKALLPVYPSKTLPNHLSIVTGRYPINNGISIMHILPIITRVLGLNEVDNIDGNYKIAEIIVNKFTPYVKKISKHIVKYGFITRSASL